MSERTHIHKHVLVWYCNETFEIEKSSFAMCFHPKDEEAAAEAASEALLGTLDYVLLVND